MRRDTPLVVAIAILAAIWFVLAMILWYRAAAHESEVADLRLQIAAMEAAEPAEGGAETAEPPVQHVEVGTEWTWPIAESDYLVVTSYHGRRISPILRYERWHQGLDIMGIAGAQIVAVADGVVVPADEPIEFADGSTIIGGHWLPPGEHNGVTYRGHPVYGGLIVIKHADGWYSLYGHLAQTWVRGGQTVVAGQIIGRQGATGASRGAHLHIELITPDRNRVNPLLYLHPKSEPAE